jgi:Ca-activated chloride channel family protein
VQPAPHRLLVTNMFEVMKRRFAWAVAFMVCGAVPALTQLPYMNAGPDSAMAQIDFAQMYLDQVNRHAKESGQQKAQDKALIDSGVVSALDLEAPNKAVEEYDRGNKLLRAQNSKEAVKHLQKAIEVYPKFVSAHVGLGLAYVDQEDTNRAKAEFEAAAKLDDKFAASFLNLGMVALSLNDFATAQPELEKAASLRPNDARILTSLAYSQNGVHQYQQALQTAQRVHTLDHKGMANVHYVAASAAMSLKDFEAMERELNFFLSEDPTNAFAPVARKNLEALTHNKTARAAIANGPQPTTVSATQLQTFPNSDRLKAQLTALENDPEEANCADCGKLSQADMVAENSNGGATSYPSPGLSSRPKGVFTLRTSVDQVAVFFSVSSHGHMISDLEQSEIHILDNSKPPEKVLQFAPQSKLPLRLALLIDTSGSVHDRFSFEKHTATKFVQSVLSSSFDLGFIAGFSGGMTVTQDFTSDQRELASGIEKLTNGGGTALFDAVSSACWKLAQYPDGERVARVLVILSDGEDNSSHGTLKQAIQAAERTGVTIYTISTREDRGDKTDADKMLEALAERSGGDAMFPAGALDLGRSFDKLRELIRSRYFIAYKPADFLPNGSYRTIDIIAEKNDKHLQVRSRKGYHARLEAAPN